MSTAIDSRIRRMANRQNLIASKCRRDSLWRIANSNNFLVSSEYGMDDDEAIKWLSESNEPQENHQ